MTKRTKTELASQVSSILPDNTTAQISPSDIRSVFTDVGDSLIFWDDTKPASATESCTKGEIKFGSVVVETITLHHLYVCIDTNTWKRAELTTFQKESNKETY